MTTQASLTEAENKLAQAQKQMTPQDYAAFLESLKVKNEGPERLQKAKRNLLRISNVAPQLDLMVSEVLEAIFILESNAKTATLVEDVKAAVKAGMDAEDGALDGLKQENFQRMLEFRRLSEPTP